VNRAFYEAWFSAWNSAADSMSHALPQSVIEIIENRGLPARTYREWAELVWDHPFRLKHQQPMDHLPVRWQTHMR
jgi:hypothetical protein